MMNRDWVQKSGQLSENMQKALGAGEDVLFYQRSAPGSSILFKFCCWIGGLVLLVIAYQMAMANPTYGKFTSGETYTKHDVSIESMGVGIVGLIVLIIPFLMEQHEYAVTKTRIIIGKRSRWREYSYDIVPIDMISGIKIQSSMGLFAMQKRSTLVIQYAGGTAQIPVMAGQGGQDLTLHLTRLLEERRTFSAHHQAQAAASPPVAASPPPAARLDKQQQLDMLRDRLIQGQISEETYNRLRKEIEES